MKIDRDLADALYRTHFGAFTYRAFEALNPGQRRICVYRYGPSWGMFRHPYRPSPELIERLERGKKELSSRRG